MENYMVYTPEAHIAITEVYAENGVVYLKFKKPKTQVYEVMTLDMFLSMVYQTSQSDSVNAEVARIMDILKQTDMSFTEFDDVTVRRLVECIQVCGNQKIIVTLKGGYQAEEELRKIEAA